MPRLEYDVVFNLNQGSVETLEQNLNKVSSGGSAESIERIKNETNELNVSLDRTAASADETKQALQGIGKGTTSLNRMKSSMQGVSNQTETFNKTANNSNQILFSFGDAMQDSSQFANGFSSGMRAVGNNLTFASEQISIMVSKAGSGKAAMKSLAGAMLGPAGLVFGINAAVTAITLWSRSSDKASKKTNELTEDIASFADEAAGIGRDLVFDPLGAISQEGKLGQLKNVESELSRLFDLRDKAEDFQSSLTDIETEMAKTSLTGGALAQSFQRVSETYSDLATEQERISGLLRDVNGQISEQEEIFGDLSKVQRQQLQDKIDDAKATASLNKALINLNPTLKFQRTLSQQLTPVIRDYNLQLQGSERELNALISSYDAQIKNLRSFGSLTEQEKNILFSLTKVREKATSALREENKELEHNLDMRFRIRQQQRAINQLGVSEIDIPRVAGQPKEDPIAREQKRIAEFLNIKESAAKKRFNIEKQLQNSLVDLRKDSEKAQTAITEAESQARKNRALTAIGAVGTGLTQLFQEQKGVAVAGAIINAGAAIVRQFKDLPLYAAIPSAALVAAKTAKQIQQITSVKPGDKNAPSAGGGSTTSGFTTSTVQNTEPSPEVGRDSAMANQPINITLNTEADNRIVSKKAEQGGKERRDKAIKVG